MIPLSHWLSEQGRKVCAPPGLEHGNEDAPDPQSLLDAAFAQGHNAGMSSAEASHEAALHAERLKFMQREREITDEWQGRCGEHISEAIRAAFLELRSGIETALMTVLRPFVDDAIRFRATDRLLVLLGEELAAGADACLEISAPQSLHADLSVRLAAIGLNSKLTVGNTMNITARLGATRFEGMASQWMDALRGTGK